jgi:hypothetical protein
VAFEETYRGTYSKNVRNVKVENDDRSCVCGLRVFHLLSGVRGGKSFWLVLEEKADMGSKALLGF